MIQFCSDLALLPALVLAVIAIAALTALLRQRAATRRQEARLAELADGIVLILRDGRVQDCSEQAKRKLGDVPGKRISELVESFIGFDQTEILSSLTALEQDGKARHIRVFDRNQRPLDLIGKPMGGRVKVVIRESFDAPIPTGQDRSVLAANDLSLHQIPELEVMSALTSTDGFLTWIRDSSGEILWLSGQLPQSDRLPSATEVEAIFAEGPPLRELSNQSGHVSRWRAEVPVNRGDTPVALQISEIPHLQDCHIGFAVDSSAAYIAERTLGRFVQTMTETFAHLKAGLAIFDRNRTLALYNPALAQMWDADPVWLARRPGFKEILDSLRSARRIPDVPDYHQWRDQLLALFDAPDAVDYEEVWHLADSASIMVRARPHPHGSIAFIFEDVSEQMLLEQRYRHSIDLRRVTLNRLHEGLAVFGPDGMVQFVNSAFHEIWGTDPETIDGSAHVRDITELCRKLTIESDVWQRLETSIASDQPLRTWGARLTMGSGRVLSARVSPLPDGGTMAIFADITDSERIALALRDRNEALEAVEEMRAAVLDQISHRLRTPLNTIFGFGQLLTDARFGQLDERQAEYANGILEASGHLLDTIDDVTELAALQLDPSLAENSDFDLGELMELSYELLEKRALEHGAELRVELPGTEIWLDRELVPLRQIVFNMLTDSIHRSQNGGQITLSANSFGEQGLEIIATERRPAGTPAPLDRVVNDSLSIALIRRIVANEGGTFDIIAGERPEETLSVCRFEKIRRLPAETASSDQDQN